MYKLPDEARYCKYCGKQIPFKRKDESWRYWRKDKPLEYSKWEYEALRTCGKPPCVLTGQDGKKVNIERDLEIYKLRTKDNRTFKSIAQQYSLTTERIRQIVAKENRKLKRRSILAKRKNN